MPLYPNHAGEMIPAPADFPNIIATLDSIVWSRKKTLHQVRYGLQVRRFSTSDDAAHEFGLCVRHQAECTGLLD